MVTQEMAITDMTENKTTIAIAIVIVTLIITEMRVVAIEDRMITIMRMTEIEEITPKIRGILPQYHNHFQRCQSFP